MRQQEFLNAMLSQAPTAATSVEDGLAIAERIGMRLALKPAYVFEFIHYWVHPGKLDESWRPVATKLQASIGKIGIDVLKANWPNLNKGARPLVFMCHASEDKPAVRKFASMLDLAGFDPWLDSEQILPGQSWDAEIRKAMRRSDAVVIFLSTRSQKRGYVQQEVLRALDEAERQPEGTIF
jgi:hypothetical protein